MKLSVISMSGPELEAQADFVCLPGQDGEVGILKDHAPMIVSLRRGKLRYRSGDDTKTFDLPGGIAEVKDNEVSIII